MTATKVIILTADGERPAIFIRDEETEMFKIFIDEYGRLYNDVYEYQFVSGTPIIKV